MVADPLARHASLLLVSFLFFTSLAGCLAGRSADPIGSPVFEEGYEGSRREANIPTSSQEKGFSHEEDLGILQTLPYRYHEDNLTDIWYAFRISFLANDSSQDMELSGRLEDYGRARDPDSYQSESFDRLWPASLSILRFAEDRWTFMSGRLFLGADWTCDEYAYDIRTPVGNKSAAEPGYDCRGGINKSGAIVAYSYPLGWMAIPETNNDFYFVVQALGDYARPFWMNITGTENVSVEMISGGYENLCQYSHMEFDGDIAGRVTINQPHRSPIVASASFGKDLSKTFTTQNYTLMWPIDSLFQGTARHHYFDPFGHEVQGYYAWGTEAQLGFNETLKGFGAFGGPGTWRYHQDEFTCPEATDTFCEAFLFVMDIPLPRP